MKTRRVHAHYVILWPETDMRGRPNDAVEGRTDINSVRTEVR
jgi:hypothetical protein